MPDKQPQTCYVFDNNGKSMIEGEKSPDGFGREFYAMASKVENVYLFTPEELAQAFREVAEKACLHMKQLNTNYLFIQKEVDKYLDQHYPKK